MGRVSLVGGPPSAGTDWARRLLLTAGLLQLAAALTPAARVRLMGAMPFFRVPTAGAILVALGALTLVVAVRPRGWWRWLPSALSGVVLAAVYWRLRTAPAGSFLDHVARHAVAPSWGFVPMGLAVLIGLAGAARARGASRS